MKINYDLIKHLERQRAFSVNTFGPGALAESILDHIGKEVDEIRKEPRDLEEWVDIMLLAMDGAWRAGHSPQEIAVALWGKMETNTKRKWPDWKTADRNKAMEHVR